MRVLIGIVLLMIGACAAEPEPVSATAPEPAPVSLPQAVIETDLGTIRIELRTDVAPISANSFIAHAEAGHFDQGSFYRTVRDDNEREGVEPMNLIQGGAGWDLADTFEGIAHETTLETGLSHIVGAVSLGRYEPGTANSEFFIMIEDYPGLDAGPDTRNPDGQGYAVFGQVIEGMDVVDAIWRVPTGVEDGPEGFEAQWIVDPVIIETVQIIANP